MRHLFLLLPLLLPAPSRAAPADDIRGIPLVATTSYDPRQEPARPFREFFTGIGVGLFGPSQDLSKAIREKLDDSAVRAYFPDAAERGRIAQLLADDAKRRYLANGYSNQSVNAALKYITDRLVGTVVTRVLMKEGVKDVNRAGAWAEKLVAPFDRCMSFARTYKEGQKCGTPLTEDLLRNVGLAMSYELTRQTFGAEAAKPRAADYKTCLRPTSPGSNDRVRGCVLQGLRKSASDFGRAQILKSAGASVPADVARGIVSRVAPAFDRCVSTATDNASFAKCGDQLLLAAGPLVAEETIRRDPRVTKYFPETADRDRVAGGGREAMTKCLAENARENRRDPSGSISTANCQSFVTMETTRTVATEVLRKTIVTSLPGASPQEKETLLKKAREQIAACWDSKKPEAANNACLRGVVKQVALDVASARIKGTLPADLQDPNLTAQLLRTFGECLDRKLPQNVLSGDGADAAANGCAAEVTKQAVTNLAEMKVRMSLMGRVPDEAVDRIVEQLVRGDLPECLGDAPDAGKLARCTRLLEKNVALQVIKSLIPPRVEEFFAKGGGIANYGLDEAGRTQLIDGVIDVQRQCLKKEVRSVESAQAAGEVDDCFKKTVKDLAIKLGSLEFARQAKANGVNTDTDSYREVLSAFTGSFGDCLDRKKGREHSVEAYLKGLEGCQLEITKTSTVQIAKSELTNVIKEVLGAAAVGGTLQRSLFEAFDGCMSAATTQAASDACVAKLKADATVALAKEGFKARARHELAVEALPAGLAEKEATLDACASSGNGADCAVTYVKESTTALGELLLEKKLKPELGERRFNKLKDDIAAKLGAPFAACVKDTPPPIDKKFLDGLGKCGDKLTESGFEYLVAHMNDPVEGEPQPQPQAPPAPAPTVGQVSDAQLADMITRTMLCLNGNLQANHEQALANLQPGSLEDQLLKLVAQYVAYDASNANGQYQDVLKQVAEELRAAGNEAARKKLVNGLAEKGMADQLLRSIVKTEMERKVRELPPGKVSPEVAAKLLSKETIDKALATERMRNLRDRFVGGVLNPVLVQGKSFSNILVITSFLGVLNDAEKQLISSPAFDVDEAIRAKTRSALGI